MFMVRVSVDHDSITYCAVVMNSFSVLALVVLEDELLLSLLDVLPVCLKGDVEERVASKR